jgi:Flp pilus assembly protein TadG
MDGTCIMKKIRVPRLKGRQEQQGAAALEFALLFTIFFGVFYAIVSYSLVLFVQQGLIQAAAEGARESARLDPASFSSPEDYKAALKPRVKARVLAAMSWLPKKIQDKVDKDGVDVDVTPDGPPNNVITVRVSYIGYNTAPLIPTLNLPVIGNIPSVPNDLVSQSTFRPN